MKLSARRLHLYLSILPALLLQCPTRVIGQSSTDAKNLRTTLFTTNGYDKTVRPVLAQTDPIDVYTSFYLLAVNDLDEVAETLKTTGYLLIEWKDEHLVWDVSNYNGIDVAFWPQNDVWKPDVALKNSFKEYKELGASALNVQVDNEGNIVWSPFQVVMHGGSKGIDLDQYRPNSAWDIADTSWSVEWESGEASIKFNLQLRRKPMYIILNMLLPIVMLAILNVMVFAIPSESGEKAGYAVTIFLAFAVFMTIISETLPENSDSTSIFSVYVVLLTVQSTVITSVALIMVRVCNFGDDTKIPRCFVFLARVGKGKLCRRNQKVQEQPQGKESTSKVEKIDIKCGDEDATAENTDSPMSWMEVMNALDLVLFVFFMFSVFISTTVCLTLAKADSAVDGLASS